MSVAPSNTPTAAGGRPHECLECQSRMAQPAEAVHEFLDRVLQALAREQREASERTQQQAHGPVAVDGEHDRPDDLHRRGRIALSEHDPRAASPARAGRMLLQRWRDAGGYPRSPLPRWLRESRRREPCLSVRGTSPAALRRNHRNYPCMVASRQVWRSIVPSCALRCKYHGRCRLVSRPWSRSWSCASQRWSPERF